MNENQLSEHDADKIEPGMDVEALGGDLGEEDVSKPKVARVERDKSGKVKNIIVKKGVIFQKELDVPVERVQQVSNKVSIEASEAELEALTALGPEQLANEAELATLTARGPEQLANGNDLLNQLEGEIPTAEGLRQKEMSANFNKRGLQQSQDDTEPEKKPTGSVANSWLRLLGPGFLGGMAGNDSSAVTAYSLDGAQNGFGHLWLMLLSTPMYQAVMYSCARIGQTSQQGLAEVLREHYGRWAAVLPAVILIFANIALIVADLVAVGSGLELITGLNWIWFVIPVALILWYLTVFSNFESLKKIFIVMSLAFLAYFFVAVLARPDWGSVLFHTFVPHLDLGFSSISSAVALLGATISPYNIFWQVQGEKEEQRTGSDKQKVRQAAADIGVGVFSGNLIAYAIIVSAAATLFTHHKGLATAADAAQAMTLILGPFAKYLFAIGLIGAGLIAIPILLAGTSYAIAGTFGWPVGLSKKPWQNEGFYLILTFSLIVSLVLALLRLDPIQLMFWANILSGVLSPILIVYLLILGNNRKLMRGKPLGWMINSALVISFLVMAAAAVLLFYSLATNQH